MEPKRPEPKAAPPNPRTPPKEDPPKDLPKAMPPKPKPVPNEPKGPAVASTTSGPWDAVSSHKDMKEMIADAMLESPEMGTFRVALKPQSKRSPIACLLHRQTAEQKFTQKAQIVVKEPGVLAVDAMCILKLIATELASKMTDTSEIKERRSDLLRCLADSPYTLLLAMQERHPRTNPENAAWFSIYERRIELEAELSQGSLGKT